jgi:hypothetical protein
VEAGVDSLITDAPGAMVGAFREVRLIGTLGT